jgi:hypothetical protein
LRTMLERAGCGPGDGRGARSHPIKPVRGEEWTATRD